MGLRGGSSYLNGMFRGRTALVCALALASAHCGAPIPAGEPMDAGDDGDPNPPPDAGLPDAGAPPADAGVDAPPDDGGTDAGTATDGGVTIGIQAGDEIGATSDVNLRTGPGTANPVILVIPRTGVSKASASESGGWVKAVYAAREGYTSAKYQEIVPPGSGADLGSTFIARGKQSVGFDYWWGHGAWSTDATTQPGGTCTGSCPSCTHTGTMGADCSGMVAKAWLVPASNWSYTTDAHPYSTYNFYNETTYWKPITRDLLQKGDAMVYRDSSAGHVFLYESGDPWGNITAIECKGCAIGCVRDVRTAGTIYKAIRRDAAVQ